MIKLSKKDYKVEIEKVSKYFCGFKLSEYDVIKITCLKKDKSFFNLLKNKIGFEYSLNTYTIESFNSIEVLEYPKYYIVRGVKNNESD